MVYNGNDRGFSGPEATTFKTKSVIQIIPEEACSGNPVVAGSVFRDTDHTKQFATNAIDDGLLDFNDEDEYLADCHLLHMTGKAPTSQFDMGVFRLGPTKVRVHFQGNAIEPTSVYAPAISWNFTVDLDTDQGQWTTKGQHDCFPAHELYIDQSLELPQYMPPSSDTSAILGCLSGVFPAESFDQTGTLP